MSSFKMRNRPKKPTEPKTISFEVGKYVALEYLLECVEKFKEEHPDRNPKEILVTVEETAWAGMSVFLEAPPRSQREYEAKQEAYKLELKAYKSWQDGHAPEIQKHKAVKKKATAKTKLKRTQERLNKELAAVEVKLGKA